MKRQNKSRISHINCKGGGTSRGNSRRAISTPIKKPRGNQQITNQANKAVWQKPPGGNAIFFQGDRLRAKVNLFGNVRWTLDGDFNKYEGTKIPFQELKSMKRAWQEYIQSPNAKRLFTAEVHNDDGGGAAREKVYQKLGFKITKKGNDKNPTVLEFDNR